MVSLLLFPSSQCTHSFWESLGMHCVLSNESRKTVSIILIFSTVAMLNCSPGIILKSIQDLNFYSLENYGIAIYSENNSPYMSLSVSIFPINCWKDIFHWLKEWVKNRYTEIGGKLCQVSLWILVHRWRGNSFFPTVLRVLAVPLGWCCTEQNWLYWAKWLAQCF